jgi:4-hydroxybenzoate polyprenyltransferase
VLAPAVLLEGLAISPALMLAAGWSWALLMFNMVLCDLRDMEGDRAAGTKSLPVLLGGNWTQGLLWGLIAGGAVCAWMHGWPILAGATVAALSPLAIAAQRRRNEAFYEWLAEGTLFLPALVELGKELARRV